MRPTKKKREELRLRAYNCINKLLILENGMKTNKNKERAARIRQQFDLSVAACLALADEAVQANENTEKWIVELEQELEKRDKV